MTKRYKSVNDAQALTRDRGYAPGATRLWYVKPEYFRNYIQGYDWLRQEGIPVPDAHTIGQTHIELGRIAETDPDRIWSMMQGERWSPTGEARPLVAGLGLHHTSMSVGDVIQTPDGGLMMADTMGFRELGTRAANPAEGSFPAPVADPSDLKQLVGAAESEQDRAQDALGRGDPLGALQAAMVAIYHSGAAVYVARQERDARALETAHEVFFQAYMLVQMICRATYPNPAPAADPTAKAAMADTRRALERARKALTTGDQVRHAMAAALHAGAAWALAIGHGDEAQAAKADGYWQQAKALAEDALEGMGMAQHLSAGRAVVHNPFVKPFRTVTPVITMGYPKRYTYPEKEGTWEIEITQWPPDHPTEWRASATHSPSGIDHKMFAETGPDELLKAMKIELDLAAAHYKSGGQDWMLWTGPLEVIIHNLGGRRPLTVSRLAREVEVYRRESSDPNFQALFDWFYDQPADYRRKFLARKVEVDNLLHKSAAPMSVPRRGRPQVRPSNPNRVSSTREMKRRLLR